MIYAQFYGYAVGSDKLIPVCGCSGVLILDGRYRGEVLHARTSEVAERRGYPAYRLYRGRTFSDSSPTTHVIVLPSAVPQE